MVLCLLNTDRVLVSQICVSPSLTSRLIISSGSSLVPARCHPSPASSKLPVLSDVPSSDGANSCSQDFPTVYLNVLSSILFHVYAYYCMVLCTLNSFFYTNFTLGNNFANLDMSHMHTFAKYWEKEIHNVITWQI